ncbi:MAG: FAD-dependent oxidoreductase, partial [Halioglobus sp.]|nr:FAD-dependent oxidoreductase [Halioglobus sp.]
MSDTVLVLGGGLAGMQAAAEVAGAGSRALVVERRPILGGKRGAALLSADCPDPRLGALAEDPAVECRTLTQLRAVGGDAGNFRVTLQEQPRYVSADCTRCNHCVPVCPEVVPNEYDANLTFRKAIHSPLPQTIPDIYSIDIDACLNSPPNYLPCQRCVQACDDDAIHFDQPIPLPEERDVAAIIVATGFAAVSDAQRAILEEFGYGMHPDILSANELQRLLEDPGPSGGFAIRP